MNKKILQMIIDNDIEGKSIKELFKSKLSYSNRIVCNIKKINGIYINGSNKNVNYILKKNDLLEVYIWEDKSDGIIPQEMNLNIIYEDEQFLVIDKEPGIVVHPTSYHFTDTLANGVMHYFEEKGIETKYRPVIRIDKDTSGIVLIAKNQLCHSFLSDLLIKKKFVKNYIAVAHNKINELTGTINKPIIRKPDSIIERMVDDTGQEAITNYQVLSQNEEASLIAASPITGRTHQIRVHLSHLGHPIYGDKLYGVEDEMERQALHCFNIKFLNPFSNIEMSFFSVIPKDICSLIKNLGLEDNSIRKIIKNEL